MSTNAIDAGGKRIVSMVPAGTEIVCALGLADRLVAVSHDCSYPPEILSRPRVTRCRFDVAALSSGEIDETVRRLVAAGEDLYEIDYDLLKRLRPDLVITQQSCDVCSVTPPYVHAAVRSLGLEASVVELHADSWPGIVADINRVASAAGRPELGAALVNRMKSRLERLAVARPAGPWSEPPRVVVLEWLDPLFACGHWIPWLVEQAGGREVLGTADGKAVVVSWDQVEAADPDYVIVACCGYDARRAMKDVQQPQVLARLRRLRAYHQGRVWTVDAHGLFSCPGPRVVETAELVHAILYDPECAAASGQALRVEPDRVA